MKKQQGIALILVLWGLSLLTIVAGSFILSIRRETAMVSGLKARAEAMVLAESGISLAQWMLLNSNEHKRWRVDGSIYEIVTDNAVLRIRLLSETGKINLNVADQAKLQQLFSRSPQGTDAHFNFANINRAAAILDWRDSDDFVRVNGAEKKQYQAANLNYQPSNQNLQTLTELSMVLGIDEETLHWLEPLVTVYGQHTDVDLQLASKEVLQVLLGSSIAEKYVKLRTKNAKNNLPPPNPPTLAAGLAQATIFDTITVISEVKSNDQAVAVIHAVLKKSANQQTSAFQILNWQSNKTNHVSLFANNMNELVIKHYAEPEFDY